MSPATTSKSHTKPSHVAADLTELVLLGNRYELGKVLGEGSYGKVRHATDKDGKVSAVKIVSRADAPDEFLSKFLPRELLVLGKVRHPNIVDCRQIVEIGEKVCIFMEYVENGDLLEYIRSKGPLSDDESRRLFNQLVSAINHLHTQNIAHRDLKCENVLLDKSYNIKLTDFGFSRMCVNDKGKRVLSETYCGSAAYAAPEILQGQPYNPKMYDVWSLGVILYTMVCASMPYDDSNIRKMLKTQLEKRVGFPSRMKGKISDLCKNIIHHMLTADITMRATIEQILRNDWIKVKKPMSNKSCWVTTRDKAGRITVQGVKVCPGCLTNDHVENPQEATTSSTTTAHTVESDAPQNLNNVKSACDDAPLVPCKSSLTFKTLPSTWYKPQMAETASSGKKGSASEDDPSLSQPPSLMDTASPGEAFSKSGYLNDPNVSDSSALVAMEIDSSPLDIKPVRDCTCCRNQRGNAAA